MNKHAQATRSQTRVFLLPSVRCGMVPQGRGRKRWQSVLLTLYCWMYVDTTVKTPILPSHAVADCTVDYLLACAVTPPVMYICSSK